MSSIVSPPNPTNVKLSRVYGRGIKDRDNEERKSKGLNDK